MPATARVPAVGSYFFPVAAFVTWNLLVFSYLPALDYDLDFTRHILMADLFLSNLVLVLAWFLCGRIVFAVFASILAVIVGYLMLMVGDWGVAVQIPTILFLYFWLKRLTGRIENEKLSGLMDRERIQEKLNLSLKDYEEKGHLLSALGRKLDRLNYMREFSDHLKSCGTLENAGRVIAEEVSRLIPEADRVLFYVCEEESLEPSLVAGVYRREEYRPREKKGTEYDDWVIKRCQPLIIEDVRTDFRFMSEQSVTFAFRSMCIVPLISKSSVCSVLHLGAAVQGAFHTDDLRLLDIVADLSAVVIRNILLYEKTRELSIVDSLTECYLLRYAQERLAEEVQRSARSRTPFAVLMVDIDYFKKYNDEFGHTAGDGVLRAIAAILRSQVGESDIVGRYGGEEFILILPQKDAAGALETARAIRRAVEEHDFRLRRESRRITVSIGVALFPEEGASAEDLIGKADQNLYRAKHEGRNRVCGST